MKFDKKFWCQADQKVGTEIPMYPERLRMLLKIIETCVDKCDADSTEMPKRPFVIAIDGRAASGKSTLAEQLSKLLGADVIRMDDFFLPPELRSEERLAEPGGNVHYERFCEDVLPYLKSPELFSYRIFDCSRMDYNGESTVRNTPIRIVEGSYSHHPKFGKYADLFVFSDVDAVEQMRRIRLRNGEEKAQMFAKKWIPMEERYFTTFGIKTHADTVI